MFKKKQTPSEKELHDFLQIVSKLEAIEFMGLVRIFNIEILKNDKDRTPRNFEEIFSDIIDSFVAASPRQRKNIMKILKAAVQKDTSSLDK